jgi:hypothetical protein
MIVLWKFVTVYLINVLDGLVFSAKKKRYFKSLCKPWDGVTMNFLPHLPDAFNKLLKL